MTTNRRYPASLVRAQIEVVLRAWGMGEADLATTAEIMVETDLSGIDSHGVSMLPLYDAMRAKGQLNLAAVPRIVRESPVMALVDAGGGLGHPVSAFAMELAIEKAAALGLAVVSVVNSHHFGAAGIYAAKAAARGMIGLVTSTARTVAVVPTFGAEPVLGTNPIAFAAPAGRNPPVLLDIATSVVAVNKVKVYALNGREIPAGWVVDGAGDAMTDAAAALRQILERPDGGLNPIGGTREMGGHKGYGLGLMAQILAGTLAGGTFTPLRRPGEPDNLGHFFLVLDPAAFRPADAFAADLDTMVEMLRGTRPAEPAQPVLVAGDPERAARAERSLEGIPLPETLLRQIAAVAEAAGAPYLLE